MSRWQQTTEKAQHRYEFSSLSLRITEISFKVLINSVLGVPSAQAKTPCGLKLERATKEFIPGTQYAMANL